MTEIEIEFGHRALTWELESHEVAKIWLKIFLYDFGRKRDLYTRFCGFQNNNKTLDTLVGNLRRIIKRINQNPIYKIEDEIESRPSRDFLNRMHHHFENLVHEVTKNDPNLLMDLDLNDALCGLNHTTHDLETILNNLDREEFSPELSTIVCEFRNPTSMPLDSKYNDLFELDFEFGNFYLIYEKAGKTPWEVFLDNDDCIKDSRVSPMDTISSGLVISFGESYFSEEMKSKYSLFLKKNGESLNNRALRNGNIVLARLKSDLSRDEIVDIVSSQDKIKSLKVKKNNKTVLSRTFCEREIFPYSL